MLAIFRSSVTMDTESSHPQDNEFAHSPWVDMGAFPPPQQQSPPLDYHQFGYGVMPIDPAYGVSIPPPYASLPLTLPSSTWPSMLTPQSQFPEGTVPPVPIPPSSTVSPVAPIPPPRKSSTSSSTPRRTLTDEDRRRMCLYHEENKTAKQTDIGALFGVERSTVSKVLRQKEKYLNPDDGSRSPIKRSKGRVPDIEKALSNWVKNYQRQGHPLSDEMIREKALFFASTCGSPDGKEKVLSTSWLEKFKQKNNLMGAKSRKGSFGTKSDSESPTRLSINSTIASAVQSPCVLSPVSPTGFGSPSPLSPMHSHENMRADGLAESIGDYQAIHAKSTTSIDTTSSVSATMTSPSSTLVSESPFTPTSQSRNSSTDGHSNRPRSQTFPLSIVDPNLMGAEDSPDQASSKGLIQQPFSGAIQESPLEESHHAAFFPSLDTSSNIIKRNRSNPEIKTKSIYPPLFSKSTTVSPVSSPSSPTQDEALKAMELVMNYFRNQPSGLDTDDYVTMGKLLERLALAKAQQTMLPGGLTRIDEHEDMPHVTRKRSIHTMV